MPKRRSSSSIQQARGRNPTKHVASLSDIAQQAGVSIMTVSRVLNGRGRFSDDTRTRILAVAESMRYRPNRLVTAFQTGRTMTVALLLPIDSPFCSAIARGAHDELSAAGYAVLLASNTHDIGQNAREQELRQVHALVERRVDGFIVRPVNDQATEIYYSEIHDRGIPMVTIDRQLPDMLCDFVGTDDRLGGKLAAQHLHALGHRRLAHFAGAYEVSSGRLRRLGFEETIRELGDGARCISIEGGFRENPEVARTLLTQEPRPTGVFAVTDWGAASIYQAAADRGLHIPQDISVVGFADLPFARFLRPSLSTFAQDPVELGRQSVRLLLERISAPRGRGGRKTILVPAVLVNRESTQHCL